MSLSPAAGTICCRYLPSWALALILLTGGCSSPSSETAQNANEAGGSAETPAVVADDITGVTASAELARPSPDSFVGSDACADCHEEIMATYQRHPMYWGATRPVTADPSPPNDTTEPIAGNTKSLAVESQSGSMIHHERMVDREGQPIFDLPYEMQYVVGSGRRAKAYVHQRGQILCLSPLNWFGKTESWGLNPGYTVDDPRRFDRRALANCLLCHTGALHLQEPGSDIYEPEPFGEMPIGCERCHGPGRDHIAYHNGPGADLTADPIVDPATLPEFERASICYQCHLQPSASRILRAGKTHEDFQPGQRLDSVWMVIAEGETVKSDGRTDSVRQVQQMHSSQCFQQSKAMRCTTCHDPHSVPTADTRVTFYRDSCTNCHAQEDDCSADMDARRQLQDSCIDCHMPKLDLALSSHAAQTDHRILKNPDALQIDREPMAPAELSFFDNHADDLPPEVRERALSIARVRRGETAQALVDSLDRLLTEFPDDGLLWLSKGSLALSRGERATAKLAFAKASEYAVSRETALQMSLELAYFLNDWSSVVETATEIITLNPVHPQAYPLLADSLLKLNQNSEAIQAAERGLELNPGSLELRSWLHDTYGRFGRFGEASEQRAIIERIVDVLSARPEPSE